MDSSVRSNAASGDRRPLSATDRLVGLFRKRTRKRKSEGIENGTDEDKRLKQQRLNDSEERTCCDQPDAVVGRATSTRKEGSELLTGDETFYTLIATTTNTTTTENQQYRPGVQATQIPKKLSQLTQKHTKHGFQIIVRLLDDTVEKFVVMDTETAMGVFGRVCESIGLYEMDYFGLQYIDHTGVKIWTCPDRLLLEQLYVAKSENILYMNVKFYPQDPTVLKEEKSRYLLCLQIRHDVIKSKLPCSRRACTLLASFAAQSELGDCAPSMLDSGYLKPFAFGPEEDDQFFEDVFQLHRSHRGMTALQADKNYLEIAHKLSLYGIHFFAAKDSHNIIIELGISHCGISVCKDRLRLNRFFWSRVTRIAYKRNIFVIRVKSDFLDRNGKDIGFKLSDRKMAKLVWRVAVENHGFFRLRRVEDAKQSKTLLCINSKFKFVGPRTHYQLQQLTDDLESNDSMFMRSAYKRFTGVASIDEYGIGNSVLFNVRSQRQGVSEFLPNVDFSKVMEVHALNLNSPFVRMDAEPIDESSSSWSTSSDECCDEIEDIPQNVVYQHTVRKNVNMQEDLTLRSRLVEVNKRYPYQSLSEAISRVTGFPLMTNDESVPKRRKLDC